ncbi:uncharacterized protein LOC143580296 [Bidens hawaiensis]|uniref:uncharacterized protein LOC143580296 n=1 Tax=Bidens hawaiensis TaxID=980011 RepID=UPI004048F042
MANRTTPGLLLPSGSTEQQPFTLTKTTNSPQETRSTSNGPIAILWDMENCPVPNDVRPEDAAGNVRMALRVHPVINGAVNMFSAYGDFNGFSRRLREGCQRTGVKLIDVPNGRKDAADKAILIDMFLFALDNPPPSSIMLISGDVDFSPALHVLGQRGYAVILVVPSGVGVSSALSNAGSYVWDWSTVVRGEGFVPVPLSRAHNIESSYAKNEEETIVYRGVSMTLTSQSSSEIDSTCVQPGDLTALKGRLVNLLEASSGRLPLQRLPLEHQKSFGRFLSASDYGSSKLIKLLKNFSDVISVEGQGPNKFVLLKKRSTDGVIEQCRKGKSVREVSSDEFSEDEKVIIEELNENFKQFRYELQDILVSYSCRVFLSCFEAIYLQRYRRPLDYKRFGVNTLEELLEKMNEVVTLHEEPVTKKKYLVATGL